jgi:hypothetical protein
MCRKMDGTGEHHTKQNKPVRERQVGYVVSLMWSLEEKKMTK